MKKRKERDVLDELCDDMVYADTLIPFEEQGIWGYRDERGRVVIKPTYDTAFFFADGLAPVLKKGKWYEINSAGKPVPPGPAFNEGLEPVRYRDVFGYVDASGEFAIQPQFKEAYSFYEGRARVRIEVRCIFTDDKGSCCLEPVHAFKNAIAGKPASKICLGKGGMLIEERFGFIDTKGEHVIPPVFLDAEDFSEGFAVVRTETGCGYVDKKGMLICKPEFYLAHDFKEGFGHVMITEDEHGYVDTQGRLASKGYEDASDFSEGLASVRKNNWRMFISKRMTIDIEGPYEDTFDFSEGMAAVKINGKWGYINKKGKLVIAPRFMMPGWFINGVLEARDRGRTLKFDKQGNEITD